MSQYERNTKYLDRHRIIYRRDPIDDVPSEIFDWGYFYKSGTYECYTLFNSRAKINTYKSLKMAHVCIMVFESSTGSKRF